MKKKKVLIVVGARPNFIKAAPLVKELKKSSVLEPMLIHTGQHYDSKMSDLFFKELGIPEPDLNLEVGSASHAVQTARIIERFEKVCIDTEPDLVVVPGDVNSTLACSLVAVKMGIKTVHYEAGLRSFDMNMPEEINRKVTDSICDLHLTTCRDADENLLNEGVKAEQIKFVGNLMIDTLVDMIDKIRARQGVITDINGKSVDFSKEDMKGKYCVMTIHRPSNVDNESDIVSLINLMDRITAVMPAVFPVHPRTLNSFDKKGYLNQLKNIKNLIITEPVGYLDFMNLILNSGGVITDSGGIQEETTYLNIPCLTLRDNTERPVTIETGSNKLVKVTDIEEEIKLIARGKGKEGRVPELWDGKTAGRICQFLENYCIND